MIILATEFIAYLNGGITCTEYLSITQPQADNPVGYFTVNDKYWGIGGNFQQRKMILIQNEKDTEIRFVQAENYLNKNKCTIYYLPISKFIMKIEVHTTTTKTPQENSCGVLYNQVFNYLLALSTSSAYLALALAAAFSKSAFALSGLERAREL